MNPVQTDIQRTNALNAAGLNSTQQNVVKNPTLALPTPYAQSYQLGATGISATPNVSTTTLSNANKMPQFTQLSNGLNNITDNQGARTDTQTGAYTYANGTAVPDLTNSADTTALTASQAEEARLKGLTDPDKIFNDTKLQTDARTASVIDNIQKQYATYIADQQEVNRRQEAGVTNSLLMGGVTGKGSSAQYTPISSEGIVASQVAFGSKQIQQLEFQKQQLISAAEAARDSQNGKALEEKINAYNKLREEQHQISADLSKKIADQNTKMREQQIQSTRDNAVADLVQQGITDPSEMLTLLNGNGGDFTLKEVKNTLDNTGIADTKKDIDAILLEAAKNPNASPEILQAISQSGSKAEAISHAGALLQKPSDILGDKLKNLQITHQQLVNDNLVKRKNTKAPYTKEDQASDSAKLETTRGEDGYVDPTAYLNLFQNWGKAGYTAHSFILKFPPKDYVNPANTWLPKVLMPVTTASATKKRSGP